MTTQSLLINNTSNESSIEVLLDSCADYLLEKQEAQAIVAEVQRAVADWRRVATRCGISVAEQNRFALRLSCS